MHRAGWIITGLSLLFISAAAPEILSDSWNWAFPPGVPLPPDRPDTTKPLSLPGSALHFTEAETRDLSRAVDWFPQDHTLMPPAVAVGRGGANACGFCHLPSGAGRPENSALAGLSAHYIKQQVNAFADGSRHSAVPGAKATILMTATAKAASDADVAVAAMYFSKQKFLSHVTVIETASVTAEPYRFVYRLNSGPKLPIGDRIIETPNDPDRFELRDPRLRYTAFVPAGSVTAGSKLVASGGPAGQPCSACHGSGLRGGIAPPLAGRSPTMLVRQLMAFKVGTRSSEDAAPMRVVAGPLDNRQMVEIAAYAATLKN